MKSLFRVMMMVAAMLVCCGTVAAQDVNRRQQARERLAQKQARHIAKAMEMDSATSNRFIETYCNYQKEIWTLAPKPGKREQRRSAAGSNEQSEKEIKARFERSEKILDIRKKYYKEYSKFLTQQQIKRVYDLERKMMNRLAKQKKDKGNKGKKGNGRKPRHHH